MNDQPTNEELTQRRIATVLTKAGIPDDTKSVNEWHGLFLRAKLKPEKMSNALQELLERCFSLRIVVRYAKDAESVFMEMLPRRQSQTNIAEYERMEADIREEQRILKEKVMADPEMKKEYLRFMRRLVAPVEPSPKGEAEKPAPINPVQAEHEANYGAEDDIL